MRHNIQNLLVRPPFYDALSGPFMPESDSAQRAHTLARLAFGAYSKGEHQRAVTGVTTGLLFSRRYEPSWARGVTATASATSHGPIHRLITISLEAPDGRKLAVQDTSTYHGFSLQIETFTAEPVQIRFLEEFRETTRRAVAEAADSFFNPNQA